MSIETQQPTTQITIGGDDIVAAENAIADVFAEIAVRQLAAGGYLSGADDPAPMTVLVDDPHGNLLTSQIVASALIAVRQQGPAVDITVAYTDATRP